MQLGGETRKLWSHQGLTLFVKVPWGYPETDIAEQNNSPSYSYLRRMTNVL